jgi:drug/metabolite transporter (DMT)-like permease
MSPTPAKTGVQTGVLLMCAGMIVFSVNDMAVKFLSGGYALHQVILIRALVGLTVILALIRLTGGSLASLRTRRPSEHLLRVGIILLSNITYFTGLAVMPLADAVAVAYVSPIAVTLMSILFLGERVGRHRWTAIVLGLAGVIVMLRPGAGTVQPAAILVLMSAVLYAAGNLLARHMGGTESALTLGAYVQIGFIAVSTGFGLVAGDGRFATDDPILAFLFRPWIWPAPGDWPILVATGISVSLGGLMVTQAFRTSEAGLIAPFEYVGMPAAIFWGLAVFGDWPDTTAWIGILLICGSGLYVLWRERQQQRQAA